MAQINEAISSNISSGENNKVDFSKLLTDLTKKNEENVLYKQKK